MFATTLQLSPLYFFGISYVFWLHFLIFSAYKAATDAGRKVPLITKILLAPVILGGVVIDAVFNLVFGWIIYGEWPLSGYELKRPKTWLLTYRCDRHLTSLQWRGSIARFFCQKLLDPFESTGHCKALVAAIEEK